MAMCFKKLQSCFMYVLAIFFGPGRGLERTPEHHRKKTVNFMFPCQHNVSSSETSRRLNTTLKSCVPKGAPKHMKDGVSAKSLRYGSVTAASQAPGIGIFDVCARSGHKTGTNIDCYFDQNSVERTMPAGNALFGNHGRCALPRLESLPSTLKVGLERMLELYRKCWAVPAFLPGGHLAGLGRHLFALLILRHNQLEEEEGSNHPVVQYMRDLAMKANLQCPFATSKHPVAVLEDCSDRLMKVHHTRNSQREAPNMEALHRAIGSLQHSLTWSRNQEQQSVSHLKQALVDRLESMERTMEKIKSLHHQENSSLREKVKHLEKKLCFLKSPASSPARCEGIQSSTPAHHQEQPPTQQSQPTSAPQFSFGQVDSVNVNAPVLNGSSSIQGGTVVGVQVTGNGTESTHQWRSNAVNPKVVRGQKQVSMASRMSKPEKMVWASNSFHEDSMKGKVLIGDVLSDLHSMDFFSCGDYTKKGVHSSCSQEKWIFKVLMDLLQFVLKKKEYVDLAAFLKSSQPEVDNKVNEKYHRIVRALMDQVYLFEGKDPDVERQLSKKKSGCTVKATVIAVAKRIQKYKAELRECLKLDKKQPCPLIEREQMPPTLEPGTPPDNKSLCQWMRKNAAAKKDSNARDRKRKPETGVVVELDVSEDENCDNGRQSKRQNRGHAEEEEDHYATI